MGDVNINEAIGEIVIEVSLLMFYSPCQRVYGLRSSRSALRVSLVRHMSE